MTPMPPASSHKSIVPFALLCVSVVIGALISVLLLNTTMSSGAYEARDLLIENANLTEQRADLLLELDDKASPQSLAEQAVELGMLPADEMGYISLHDGTVWRAKDLP